MSAHKEAVALVWCSQGPVLATMPLTMLNSVGYSGMLTEGLTLVLSKNLRTALHGGRRQPPGW